MTAPASQLPKVSIVIPSYKAEHFEQCLRSAIGQSYPHTEILVSDNCPTDAIEQICARFPGVLYQRNTVIRTDNVLSALYSGKGHYIKPLFDDDILHPFCVERMVTAMTGRDEVQLVFSASQVIDARNDRLETRRPYQANGTLTGRDLHRSMVLGMQNFIGEFSSIMFRRDKLWQIGWQRLFALGPHDCTRGLADVAAYLNLVEGGSAFYIDEELSYFRRDPVLQSNSNPHANPDFGYCFSDYFDLLLASHTLGVVSDEELLAQEPSVAAARARLAPLFSQVEQSYQRYLAYAAPLKG
ncbi:glycosyltransferase family 2 protein [Pseudoduganella sp. OTU4001]|uniref:glycosyltransferase family 2 protein n=1 Tax=Pseudoduganella sp. OTU4001 TaxID=3043854 RepID=UPI00313E2712